MRHTKLLRIMILLVLAAALLASCGRSRTSALPKAGQSPAVQAPEETPPADQDTMPEEFEPDEEEAPFLASYIGKTGGDVVRDFGDEYETGYYEGSTFITYPDDFSFLFGTAVDEVTDDLIIRQMMAAGQWPVVYDLTGSMTYSEIVDAVGGRGGCAAAGALVQRNLSRVTDCRNTGMIRSEGPARMGGIVGGPGVGMKGGAWTVSNCWNDGVISFGSGTRDFAKDAESEMEFMASLVVDPSTMSEEEYQIFMVKRLSQALGGACIGGIAGTIWFGTIENCASAGTILLDEEKASYTGGICGMFHYANGDSDSLLQNCRYVKDWPVVVMSCLGTTEILPEGAVVDVVGSIEER